jgi:hypothetical protein
MKAFMTFAVTVALLVSFAGLANAKASHPSHAGFVQRDVRLQGPSRWMPPPNADLKYGPQPDYPQSPPGGGY